MRGGRLPAAILLGARVLAAPVATEAPGDAEAGATFNVYTANPLPPMNTWILVQMNIDLEAHTFRLTYDGVEILTFNLDARIKPGAPSSSSASSM